MKGRYGFKDVALDGSFDPAVKGTHASLSEAVGRLDDLATGDGATFVLGPSLTEQEVRALFEYAELRAPKARFAMTVDSELAVHLQEAAGHEGLKRGVYSSLNGVSPDGVFRHGESDAFLLIGTNTDEDQPVLTSWLRRAVRHKKSSLVYIGRTPGLLDKGGTLILKPAEGKMAQVLRALASAVKGWEVKDSHLDGTGVSPEELRNAVGILAQAKKPLTLIGGESPAEEAFDAAASLKDGNYLLLLKGAGSAAILSAGKSVVDANELRTETEKGGPLLFIDTSPEEAGFSAADLDGVSFAVLSSKLTNLGESADVLIPLLPWIEKDGDTTNLEGQRLAVHRGPLTEKAGVSLCALLAEAAMPYGGRIHSNPVAAS